MTVDAVEWAGLFEATPWANSFAAMLGLPLASGALVTTYLEDPGQDAGGFVGGIEQRPSHTAGTRRPCDRQSGGGK